MTKIKVLPACNECTHENVCKYVPISQKLVSTIGNYEAQSADDNIFSVKVECTHHAKQKLIA